MYTEICAELGEAIATTNSAPGIQFHLILTLLFGNSFNDKLSVSQILLVLGED
jgi:hypothetical protein